MKTMDMIKITKEMIPEIAETIVHGENNTSVAVRSHIPYDQKEAFALEYAAYVNVEDRESLMMYDNYRRDLIEMILIAKYYTNIDVAELSVEDDWRMLHDWIVFNHLDTAIMQVIEHDYDITLCMAVRILNDMQNTYKKVNSLPYLIQKTFGSMFTGEDFSEAFAKASDVNNQMVDMLGAYRDMQQKNNTPENQIMGGKLDLGGRVINIAKKNTGKSKK